MDSWIDQPSIIPITTPSAMIVTRSPERTGHTT
jgi:hypothetical protein